MLRPTLTVLATTCATALLGQAGPPQEPKDGWSIRAGAMLASGPSAIGSEQRLTRALPILDVAYGDFFLGGNPAIGGLGLGVHALRSGELTWDVALIGAEGRKEKRADVLAGMGDQSASLWAGSMLSRNLGPVRIGLAVAHGFGSDLGNRARLDLASFIPILPGWHAGVNLAADFSDAKAMAYQFAVSPDQALTRQALLAAGDPRLRAGEARVYTPGSGIRDLTVGLNLMHPLSASWHMMMMVNGMRLLGQAAEGPLVRARNPVSCGAGLSYTFK